METTGIGLGDAMCLAKNGMNNEAGYMWNNPFFYLIFLALFGNGGFGGFGNNGAVGYGLGQQTAEIQNSIYASNAEQSNQMAIRDVARQINQVGDGISSATFALKDSISGLGAVVNNGFDKIGYGLMENRFVGQQGVTDIQQAIAETNYNNSQNTCRLENAIKDSTGLILNQMNANTVQALRDKLCETNQKLTSAEFALSQQAQNAYLVEQLKTTA